LTTSSSSRVIDIELIFRPGQVLIDFDVLDRWNEELSQINHAKIGESFDYPNSFIEILGYKRAILLLYRLDPPKFLFHTDFVYC
jgi:hypothetical protein